jgi:hypothetical protein
MSEIDDLVNKINKLNLNDFKEKFSENFKLCVSGYHLINDDPIKESPWEDINSIIFKESGCKLLSQSNGSHKSGVDLNFDIGSFSNKSSKYSDGVFKVSSYRLTEVCNNGNIEDIIAEINKRKNFDYYSIICREKINDSLNYDWYLIPSDYKYFDPSFYTWKQKLSKKGSVIGWETDTIGGSGMTITFSMSSQLWITISFTKEIKDFIVGSCEITKGRKMNYIDLFKKMNI